MLSSRLHDPFDPYPWRICEIFIDVCHVPGPGLGDLGHDIWFDKRERNCLIGS